MFKFWFLVSFFNKRNHGSLKKWLVLGLGQRRYKMSLRYLVVPGGKKPHNDGTVSKAVGA